MNKTRLEAFSDAVIAIILTIMVLELKVPHGTDLETISALLPVFLSYVLSFVYVGIYWNNHHHLLHAVKHVNGKILWANMYLMFWLSLIAFVTGWAGENNFAPLPVAAYGFVLFMSGSAYMILTFVLIHSHGRDSLLARALGRDFKGKASILAYALAIPLAFFVPYVAITIYVSVAALWLIPDARIESATAHGS